MRYTLGLRQPVSGALWLFGKAGVSTLLLLDVPGHRSGGVLRDAGGGGEAAMSRAENRRIRRNSFGLPNYSERERKNPDSRKSDTVKLTKAKRLAGLPKCSCSLCRKGGGP